MHASLLSNSVPSNSVPSNNPYIRINRECSPERRGLREELITSVCVCTYLFLSHIGEEHSAIMDVLT